MKVIEFNRQKGIFNFELEEIDAQLHKHPATEIIFSEAGKIQIESKEKVIDDVIFAVIDANTPHKILSEKGSFKLLMVECNPLFLSNHLTSLGIKLNDGIFVEKIKSEKSQLIETIVQDYSKSKIAKSHNPRVNKCFEYLDSTTAEYSQMIQILKAKINLSESRLSHIFKEETGISLKKYLVWSRLKKAFQLVVTEDINIYQASIKSGFYDQAHLSKAFKQMLGLNPSEVFNSRMLQG